MADLLAVGSVAPEQRSKIYWAISDSLVLIKRSVRHIWRNVDQLLLVVVLPINILLLFRYVFGGAIDTGDTIYVNYVIAGIIIQSMAFNISATAVSVCSDLQKGITDRFRSLPMIRSAVLTGHVVADMVRNVLSTCIMILAGLIVGFRPSAGVLEWIAVLGVILLFSLMLSWIAAIFGLLAKSVEGAGGLTFTIVFLPYLSTAFVPTDHMPTILRIVADNQPITHFVETLRGLTIGTPIGDHGWLALGWGISITAVASTVAVWLFKRKTMR
jgi:ABC-2 type transport system permease protein